jgi:FMN phosphatase YigB (HAD superfamily)
MSPERPHISLVVTDLDNTLYDWVTFFVSAFYRMVDTATELLAVDREELLDQLRDVHRRYHDSEYPFALLETRIVRERYGASSRRDLKQRLDAAFQSFNEVRDRTLQLYPTVLETLVRLRSLGTIVVGHTEASAPNAFFRLRKLQCLPLVSRLYALEHDGQDHPVIEKSLRFQEERERVHFLRPDQRKPNPAILLTICQVYGVSPSNVLYVGDSISRDIGMAKEAGTRSAFAEYGLSYDKVHWSQLVRVTHWSEEDVRRNEETRKLYSGVKADVVLNEAFGQILEHFTFGSELNSAQT